MSNNKFCLRCSGFLNNIENGYYICNNCKSKWEVNHIDSSQAFLENIKVDDLGLLDANYRENSEKSIVQLKEMELEEIYLTSGGAREEFQKKVDFFTNEVKPIYDNWLDKLNDRNDLLTNIKTTLVQNIYNISNAIIKDYIGIYNASTTLTEYESLLDLEKYDLNIDIQELQQQTNAMVSPNVSDVLDTVIATADFKKIEKNLKKLGSSNSWRSNRAKKNLQNAGIDIAFSLVENALTAIDKNVSAIKEIRKADESLINTLDEMTTKIEALTINQNEVLKNIKYAKIQLKTFTICLLNFQQNVKEFNDEPLFLEYKNKRKKILLKGELLNLYKELSAIDIIIPYEKVNDSHTDMFDLIYSLRIEKFNKMERLSELLEFFNMEFPKNVMEILNFQKNYFSEYRDLENEYRNQFKSFDSYSHTREEYVYFINVLKAVKKFINNK